MKNRKTNQQAAALRAKNEKTYPSQRLGPSGKPKSHTKHHTSKKAAIQAAKQASRPRGRAHVDGPHAHHKYHHAHSAVRDGKRVETKPKGVKVKHSWGPKTVPQDRSVPLQRSGFRQPKSTPNKGLTR